MLLRIWSGVAMCTPTRYLIMRAVSRREYKKPPPAQGGGHEEWQDDAYLAETVIEP